MGADVTIEALTGQGAAAAVFAAGAVVRVIVDDTRRMVRDATGQQVVSETTLMAPLGTTCPVGSRVTLPSGRIATALAVLTIDGGTLPVPSHLEISLT
jgi:hypothetical protein